jgi:hypothetical protein
VLLVMVRLDPCLVLLVLDLLVLWELLLPMVLVLPLACLLLPGYASVKQAAVAPGAVAGAATPAAILAAAAAAPPPPVPGFLQVVFPPVASASEPPPAAAGFVPTAMQVAMHRHQLAFLRLCILLAALLLC